MENFRINRAYRLSLYLLLLVPIFAGIALLLQEVPTNMFPIITIFTAVPLLGFISFLFIISIPILFLGALSFRFLSMDPFKRWMDIIFIILGSGLMYFISTKSHTCPALLSLDGSTASLQWTPASMFDVCSHYDILGEMRATAIILFVISLALAMWFLISDIRRKRATINTI